MSQTMLEGTCDPDRAENELREFGATVLEGALDEAMLGRAQRAVAEIADRERESGEAILESGAIASSSARLPGANQRIVSLMGKGDVFGEIVRLARPLTLIRDRFRESYELPTDICERFDLDEVLLSSVTANIARLGGVAQDPHTDQGFAPANTPFPLVMNCIFMLTPFTAENGATLIAPGSHLKPLQQHYADPPTVVPACGEAGSVLIFDGRLWHGTGVNRTDDPRVGLLVTYCRPFMRQFENFALSIPPSARARLSPELRALLGFRVWMLLGGTDGQPHGTMIG